jgi:hypothetical protein
VCVASGIGIVLLRRSCSCGIGIVPLHRGLPLNKRVPSKMRLPQCNMLYTATHHRIIVIGQSSCLVSC